jgi:hypothetical protein
MDKGEHKDQKRANISKTYLWLFLKKQQEIRLV